MLRAVIFDFDGVIADSELLHYKAMNEVFNRYGVDVPKEKHWAEYLGYTDIENIEAVSRDYDMDLTAEQVTDLARQKTELFDELAKSQSAIIEGVAEFIAMLKANGIRMAICSGALASDVKLMLDGSGLEAAFEIIVAADDVSRGKPDPEGYMLALERLNERGDEEISAGECVVVEDSHWGLEAAQAAGMHTVAVTNTYPADQLAEYAEMVVQRLDEVTMDDLQRICIG